MSIFISHRTADDALAQQVAQRLKQRHGISCYVDDFDKEAAVARDTSQITSLIVRRLQSCTNLLAIVTQNTQGSWWVPFEIGVARMAPRVITTYTNLVRGLPEYLNEWPVLQGPNALDTFARLYKNQRLTLNEQILRKQAGIEDQHRTVETFHIRLKASLEGRH